MKTIFLLAAVALLAALAVNHSDPEQNDILVRDARDASPRRKVKKGSRTKKTKLKGNKRRSRRNRKGSKKNNDRLKKKNKTKKSKKTALKGKKVTKTVSQKRSRSRKNRKGSKKNNDRLKKKNYTKKSKKTALKGKKATKTVSCSSHMSKTIRRWKERNVNFKRQAKQYENFKRQTDKKKEKKDVFGTVANRLIGIGGGRRVTPSSCNIINCFCLCDNLACAGSNQGDAADNMTELAKGLIECEETIKTSCDSASFPAMNTTLIAECEILEKDFNETADGCFQESKEDNSNGACDCWSGPGMTGLMDETKNCAIDTDLKKFKNKAKNCLQEFSACKKLEDSAVKMADHCSYAPSSSCLTCAGSVISGIISCSSSCVNPLTNPICFFNCLRLKIESTCFGCLCQQICDKFPELCSLCPFGEVNPLDGDSSESICLACVDGHCVVPPTFDSCNMEVRAAESRLTLNKQSDPDAICLVCDPVTGQCLFPSSASSSSCIIPDNFECLVCDPISSRCLFPPNGARCNDTNAVALPASSTCKVCFDGVCLFPIGGSCSDPLATIKTPPSTVSAPDPNFCMVCVSGICAFPPGIGCLQANSNAIVKKPSGTLANTSSANLFCFVCVASHCVVPPTGQSCGDDEAEIVSSGSPALQGRCVVCVGNICAFPPGESCDDRVAESSTAASDDFCLICVSGVCLTSGEPCNTALAPANTSTSIPTGGPNIDDLGCLICVGGICAFPPGGQCDNAVTISSDISSPALAENDGCLACFGCFCAFPPGQSCCKDASGAGSYDFVQTPSPTLPPSTSNRSFPVGRNRDNQCQKSLTLGNAVNTIFLFTDTETDYCSALTFRSVSHSSSCGKTLSTKTSSTSVGTNSGSITNQNCITKVDVLVNNEDILYMKFVNDIGQSAECGKSDNPSGTPVQATPDSGSGFCCLQTYSHAYTNNGKNSISSLTFNWLCTSATPTAITTAATAGRVHRVQRNINYGRMPGKNGF